MEYYIVYFLPFPRGTFARFSFACGTFARFSFACGTFARFSFSCGTASTGGDDISPGSLLFLQVLEILDLSLDLLFHLRRKAVGYQHALEAL